jgi:hypothetical protein
MPTALDTPLTYPTYTNRSIDEGVFEQLMAAVKHHVHGEFKAGRIQADTYGQVYLGLTEAVLQNATQYILGLLLIDEKRRGQDLANQQAEYQLEVLMVDQHNKTLKEIEFIDKQMEKIDAEIVLMVKQGEKIDKEIEFLTAKIVTERANTEAGVADTGSLIGKQITLLTAQRMGFAGDIQTKIGKLYADYDAVFQSVQETPTAISLLSGADASPAGSYTVEKLAVAEGIASSISALP